ncbi:cytochrome P450 [Novosphingobium sp. JCM 18896]|uniref:cytochrome P450 n=1 Tax=Novosphingobium sp. JCM 18896 TaxID=2989731 RepID=UPI0022230A6B|nr:cytochrome P450 [Novosphingobium sp. JCM 18896]MCW1430165.1 cytochrome P450 [Novosphingobium sp. JCM 18896]
MRDYTDVDFYTDTSLVEDPHSYFDFLREQNPVQRLPYRNVVAVTGYEETIQVMLDAEHFSSVNAVNGPIPDLPFKPQGDDITAEVRAARSKIAYSDQVVTEDGKRHADLRSILAMLFTPSRLKALEPSLRSTADTMIAEFAGDGKVDLVAQYGGPYATLVIADLLGVPHKDRPLFRKYLENAIPAEVGGEVDMANSGFAKIGKHIFGYMTKRRLLNKPGIKQLRQLLGSDDSGEILTEVALAKFPDGSLPSLVDVTSLGAFLFGAGQDTTNRLLSNGFRILAERPDIQEELRADSKRIGAFLEELLRFEGSVKSGGRLCVKTTTVGGVEIKAGTTLLLSHMAANRDPKRFDNPHAFDMNRPKAKEHLAFGRGAHTCIGAPLARKEVTVSIERLLARMGNIRLDEEFHGPEGNRRFDYEPTYILRALKSLHLKFDPIG